MNLRQALDQLECAPHESASSLQVLERLHDLVKAALRSRIRGDRNRAQQTLKEALPHWVQAMQALEDERHESGTLTKLTAIAGEAGDRKTIHINRNRAEVRVNDELRGSWSIWTVADLQEVCRLAEEFDCGLVYSSISAFASRPRYQFPPSA